MNASETQSISDYVAYSHPRGPTTSTRSLKSDNSASHSQKPNMETKETVSKSCVTDSIGAPSKVMSMYSGIQVGSLLKTWTEISKINLINLDSYDMLTSRSTVRCLSTGLRGKDDSIQNIVPPELHAKSGADLFEEKFPNHVTPLMNEDRLWGSFYIFPEHYGDEYSPVVRIRCLEDVPNLVEGVLTRDRVAACLTYLKRTPILGDYVFIKLNLSSMHLVNVEVLQHYKYLVYLDLSQNLLKDLKVLSNLLYLQYLNVSYNRMDSVLDYDTPQWFLTEVHYKYNSVTKIRNLDEFWSITVLDLSHNNIKHIDGLKGLRYLRRLDLSFNHIQRLENLDNLRIMWLDVSYNNISSYEHGSDTGLWTLTGLEYLNLNDNNLVSLKVLSKCTRLRELYIRNNRFNTILEMAVYLRQLHRLVILDLRANPICSSPWYKDVILSTFPSLLNLDGEDLDPVDVRTTKMDMTPDVMTFATRRLLRLLYIEQLTRTRMSPFVPPADTTIVPLVVLVGYEGVGKGKLARRLASECSNNVELALQHTTANYHYPNHYHGVTRDKFDEMLLAGDLLTYTESNSESYGLSKKEASVKDGKVRIATMDLSSALMLKLRGRNAYLILATFVNKKNLLKTQNERKIARDVENDQRIQSIYQFQEKSALQAVLSGRIIIAGILNEILLTLPEVKEYSEFILESDCSLEVDDPAKYAGYRAAKFALTPVVTEEVSHASSKLGKPTDPDSSLYSLYKESQGTGDYAVSDVSYTQDSKRIEPIVRQDKLSAASRTKSVDFSKCTASGPDKGESHETKLSKSVGFIENGDSQNLQNTIKSMMVEEQATDQAMDKSKLMQSISTKFPWREHGHSATSSVEDLGLWFSFLAETGIIHTSDIRALTDSNVYEDETSGDHNSIMYQLDKYNQPVDITTAYTIRDDYENIHINRPGLFWDTVTMDDPDQAFYKVKNIIQHIVQSQKHIKPMYNIDFTNMKYYPTVQKRLVSIRHQVAPQRLFY